MTLECTKNNSTGPHKPMNIIRNSLLAKITLGYLKWLRVYGCNYYGHMVAIIKRINIQTLTCSQTIHRENLLHTQHSRCISLQDENYSVGRASIKQVIVLWMSDDPSHHLVHSDSEIE